MPADTDTAFFGRGSDAKLFDRPRELLANLLAEATLSSGMPEAERKAVRDLIADRMLALFTNGGTGIYAKGFDQSALERVLKAKASLKTDDTPGKAEANKAVLEQVIGWHWASPAPVMKLAEIVRTASTSEETIATVSDMAARCGKNPIVVNDTPTSWGFVANRVYFAMIREANRVVDEGVATREQVDQLMTDCFRWPAGPFGMVRGATGGWS